MEPIDAVRSDLSGSLLHFCVDHRSASKTGCLRSARNLQRTSKTVRCRPIGRTTTLSPAELTRVAAVLKSTPGCQTLPTAFRGHGHAVSEQTRHIPTRINPCNIRNLRPRLGLRPKRAQAPDNFSLRGGATHDRTSVLIVTHEILPPLVDESSGQTRITRHPDRPLETWDWRRTRSREQRTGAVVFTHRKGGFDSELRERVL